MKFRLISFILCLSIVVGFMTYSETFAWFVTSVSREQLISVSIVNFSTTAQLATDNVDSFNNEYILPDQNLVKLDNSDASIKAVNSSTIPTNVRVRIEYTSYDKEELRMNNVYAGSADDAISVDFAKTGGNSRWASYKIGTGKTYFYYMGQNYSGPSTLENLNAIYAIPAGEEIEILSSILYKGEAVGSEYTNKSVEVRVIFEAKQSVLVDWNQISEYVVSSSLL